MQLRSCIKPFAAMLTAASLSCQAHVYSLHAYSGGTLLEYNGFINPPQGFICPPWYGLHLRVYSFYEDSNGFTIMGIGHEVERGGVYHRYADIGFGACLSHIRMPTEDEELAHSPFQVHLIEAKATTNTEGMIVARSSADPNRPEVLHVQKTSLLDHSWLSSAAVVKKSDLNGAQVVVMLDRDHLPFFADIKRQNAGRRIGIILDGKLVAAPQIEALKVEERMVLPCKLAALNAAEIAKKIEESVEWSNFLGY
jgi:hypothetical protein